MEDQIPRRVRIYYPYFPFPANEGSHVVVAQQVMQFVDAGYRVELVHWLDSRSTLPPLPEGISPAAVRVTRLGRFKCDESASSRGARVLRSLVSPLASPEMRFYPPHLAQVEVPAIGPQDANDPSESIDLAIYNYSFAYAWLRTPPRADEKKRVVVFHNQESELFVERAAMESSFFKRAIHRLNAQKLRAHENQVQSLVNEVWWISARDQKQGAKEGVRHRYLPPFFAETLTAQRTGRFAQVTAQKPILGFVGRLDFHPNAEGLSWFLTKVAPTLQRRGFAGEVWVAGKGATPELKSLAETLPFVKWLDFVPDLEDFWAHLSLLLVPHVFGSGVRIKLIEALASRIPVLTHTAAAEALDPRLRGSTLVIESDQAEDWIEKLLKLQGTDLRRAGQKIQLPSAWEENVSNLFA